MSVPFFFGKTECAFDLLLRNLKSDDFENERFLDLKAEIRNFKLDDQWIRIVKFEFLKFRLLDAGIVRFRNRSISRSPACFRGRVATLRSERPVIYGSSRAASELLPVNERVRRILPPGQL